MTWLAARLATGSGRAELLRALLVVLGGGLSAVLLLSAALVSAVRGGACRATTCGLGLRYRTALLDQAGLRPGVVLGLLLMVLPVLVFLGMCARISAAQRERRLAAVRLAGATPGQVRLLTAVETAAPAAVGALLGLGVVVVAKVLLERSYGHAVDALLASGVPPEELPARRWPSDVALPVVRSALVLLLVPALSGASAVAALRRVQVTPLGVVRRTQPAPRPTGLVALVLGLAVLVLLPLLGRALLPLVVPGAALLLLAVAASSTWIAARTGRTVAVRTARPAALLAARRLQADPRAQGRALAGVVMATLIASGAEVLRSGTLRQQGEDDFYRRSYALVELGLVVALVVAAAGLLVASCESVVERRRTLASLSAAGVPLATLRRAVLLQSLLPAVPAVLLATGAGGVAGQLLVLGFDEPALPGLRLLLVPLVALGAVAGSTVLTLPLLRRSVQPAELRAT